MQGCKGHDSHAYDKRFLPHVLVSGSFVIDTGFCLFVSLLPKKLTSTSVTFAV